MLGLGSIKLIFFVFFYHHWWVSQVLTLWMSHFIECKCDWLPKELEFNWVSWLALTDFAGNWKPSDLHAGLLIGQGQKVKFCKFFRVKFPGKMAYIPGNLQANVAEKRSVKRQPILWQFSKHISLESVWFCIDLTNIFQIKKTTILPIWATCLDHNTCKLCVCITTRFIFDIDHHLLMTTVSIPSFATLIKERLW